LTRKEGLKPWVSYLVGRLLEGRGYRDQAQPFYKLSAASPSNSPVIEALANEAIEKPFVGPEGLNVVDLISKRKVTPEELSATRNLGLRIKWVAADGPADKSGLERGDLILCMDGFRILSDGEYVIVRGMETKQATIDLVLNRGGKVIELQLKGLLPGRRGGGFSFDHQPRLASIIKAYGLRMEQSDGEKLEAFPPSAEQYILHWFTSGQHRGKSKDWLRQHLALYLNLVNQDFGKARAPTEEAPIPFINELNRFYLSIANHNKGGEQKPDWKSHGVELDFYALYYPFPRFRFPPASELTLTDREFVRLLGLRISDPTGSIEERRNAAREYTDKRGGEEYVGQVKAALLAPRNHGGWPFRSSQVRFTARRKKTVAGLLAKYEQAGPDAVLYAYCLVAPTTMDRNYAKVGEYINFIARESPYLGVRAVNLVLSCERSYKLKDAIPKVASHLTIGNLELTPKPSVFYRTLMSSDLIGPFFPFGKSWMLYYTDKVRTDLVLRAQAHILKKTLEGI
jgi:hypothetical protein